MAISEAQRKAKKKMGKKKTRTKSVLQTINLRAKHMFATMQL